LIRITLKRRRKILSVLKVNQKGNDWKGKEKFKSLVNADDTIMQKEFDANAKENNSTIRIQVSAINNSFYKLMVSTVNSKLYLDEIGFEKDDDVIFKKLADMAKMMGVESMGDNERIVDEPREANLNKASDDACEKDMGKTGLF
jgi:hypothetical protein